jgi:uncharacterized protein
MSAEQPSPVSEFETLYVAGPHLRVGPSHKHGLGVFAAKEFRAGDLVHLAPVILMDDLHVEMLEDTPLRGYVYGWEGPDGHAAFAFGVGSLINHSGQPNCVYHRIDTGDIDEATGFVHTFDALAYSAAMDIAVGEELTVDYSGGDPSILWFDPI